MRLVDRSVKRQCELSGSVNPKTQLTLGNLRIFLKQLFSIQSSRPELSSLMINAQTQICRYHLLNPFEILLPSALKIFPTIPPFFANQLSTRSIQQLVLSKNLAGYSSHIVRCAPSFNKPISRCLGKIYLIEG